MVNHNAIQDWGLYLAVEGVDESFAKRGEMPEGFTIPEGGGMGGLGGMEEVLRYFVVHNFTLNSDSYTGSIIHNYYLYEEDGKLAMIPWDYNLAFDGMGNMGRGMTTGTDSATPLVNYPIDTPSLKTRQRSTLTMSLPLQLRLCVNSVCCVQTALVSNFPVQSR
jgi:hypothetical protein